MFALDKKIHYLIKFHRRITRNIIFDRIAMILGTYNELHISTYTFININRHLYECLNKESTNKLK